MSAIAEMDRIAGYSESEGRSSDAFLCTPVLGQTRRKLRAKVDMEIETRLVSAIKALSLFISWILEDYIYSYIYSFTFSEKEMA